MTIFSCPMHPEVQSEKEGSCPECGMKLLPVKKEKKHDQEKKHEGHSLSMFFRRFLVSLILTIPVILYSDILEKLFNFNPPSFTGSFLIPLILSSIIFFYGGLIFLTSARREISGRQPGMMTLIAMAISVAYIYSIFSVFFGGSNLFWELSTLITIMLLGHYLEMRSVQSAQGALKELSKLLPDTAEVIRNGKIIKLFLREVKVGDIVFVKPGGSIPTDGVVLEGSSDVNEAMITGESKPVLKEKNSGVIAGTINGSGSLKIKVSKTGEKTFLSGIMRLVEEAQNSKSKLQILSDRAAFYLTFIAISTGGITFFSWIIFQKDFSFAIERTVAVLVIACPHALGLAVPLVASISTSMAAKSGFLVKQRLALESARNINTVLFDKTGTLTKGEYGLSKVWAIDIEENKLLQLAVSLESHSEHYIAKAIIKEGEKRKLKIMPVKNFAAIPGKGAKGRIGDDEILIGGSDVLGNQILAKDIDKEIREENKKGKSIIYVAKNKKVIGVLSLSDIIRSESFQAILDLKKMGIKTAMLTGDSEEVAKWVAKDLEIDEFFANVKPEEKENKVKILQSERRKVAMVGDGINDAPALTTADLGIAIGAGTNVAIESAGIILVRNDPRDIVKIIKLSKLTYSKMLQNIFWATGYNVVAIPLAAGILASKGILLQPAVAALLMSFSTVIVAFNAILLKKENLN